VGVGTEDTSAGGRVVVARQSSAGGRVAVSGQTTRVRVVGSVGVESVGSLTLGRGVGYGAVG
jgi:hypothetical protein